jgi:o-succinylbenzoate---CoA ligase
MERAELAKRLGADLSAVAEAGGPVVVDEREPQRFMTRFGEAVATGGPVFLANPEWSARERAEMNALLPTGGEKPARGWLMIPSGGTGGRVKFARHDEETLGAAVRGFCAHFGMERVNAVGVLPLHHVSGLMAWMRCALSGGEYLPLDWKRLEGGEWPALDIKRAWVLSLVPTQLQRLLARAESVAWVRQFRAIFVGGGPTWPELAEAAAREELPVSLSYGMTETAAMVTALRPEEFLAGARSCGAALPHARVAVNGEGVVCVTGESVFRGYFPELKEAGEFVTEDLGRLDERGHLHLLGRRDAAIITGGKKVQPAEVEAVLRASGEFIDVAVIGVPDAEWGQAVVACYVAGGRTPDIARAVTRLAAYERPKRFVAIAEIPRNGAGKVNRAELARRIAAT